MLVNFIDLVRSKKSRQQIRKRLENFLLGEKSIIVDESRLHLISAEAVLSGILQGEENEYFTDFNNFNKSIEKFLAVERGAVQIKQILTKISILISEGIKALEQAQKILDGEVYFSVEARIEILGKIENASRRDVKILSTTEKLSLIHI